MDNTQTHGKYISWPILTLMAFVTVIGFDDIMYNFKNQGMTVITSWILMLFLYVIPYSLMVGQLGSVFNKEGGGLSSWIRGTNGEFLGYFTAWTYWAASVPYVVDSANSVVVGFGWAFTGSGKFQDTMSNAEFTLWTFIIFIIFIFAFLGFEHVIANFPAFSLAYFASNGAIEAFTAGNVIHNLFWAFIGNFIGGGLIMGLGYAWLDKDNKNLTYFD